MLLGKRKFTGKLYCTIILCKISLNNPHLLSNSGIFNFYDIGKKISTIRFTRWSKQWYFLVRKQVIPVRSSLKQTFAFISPMGILKTHWPTASKRKYNNFYTCSTFAQSFRKHPHDVACFFPSMYHGNPYLRSKMANVQKSSIERAPKTTSNYSESP